MFILAMRGIIFEIVNVSSYRRDQSGSQGEQVLLPVPSRCVVDGDGTDVQHTSFAFTLVCLPPPRGRDVASFAFTLIRLPPPRGRKCGLQGVKRIIIIIIILESAVQCRERVRTLSVQRPQPHTTNPWKEEKDKTVGDKK